MYRPNALTNTILAAGLAMSSAAACGGIGEGAPAPSHSASSQPFSPETPPPMAPVFEQDPIVSQLLGGAAINIILLEPKHPTPSPDPDPAVVSGQHLYRRALAHEIPSTLHAVGVAFETATYGRYQPRSVSVTRVHGKIAIGCITNANQGALEDRQGSKIQAAAEPYNKPGALNIVALDQEPCMDRTGTGVVGGFDEIGTSDDPVVDEFSFDEQSFEAAVIHETGHRGGLLHAGTASCAQPEAIEDCSLNPVDDPLSVMGYTQESSANRYTYPELGALGLLHGDEILAVDHSGEYVLHTMGHAGLKVLALPDADGNPIYFSFEHDPSAAYDERCVRDPTGNRYDDPMLNRPHVLFEGETGTGVNYVCFAVDRSSQHASLQVRTLEYSTASDSLQVAQEYMADILRKPRLHTKFDTQLVSGEIRPGHVVFRSAAYVVRLLDITGNSATVQISATR